VRAPSRDSFTHLREESLRRLHASERVIGRQVQQVRLRTSLAVGLLLVGFMLVAQWRGVESSTAALESQSDQDLAIIVQELTQTNAELREEAALLEDQLREAVLTEQGQQELLNQAARELLGLRVLTGLDPAVGPGVVVRVTDPARVLLPRDFVTMVNELRAAGAEAISIDGIRVGSTPGFSGDETGIYLDAEHVSRDAIIYAIGRPETLEQALLMPGGLARTLSAFPSVEVEVAQSDELELPAVVVPEDDEIEHEETG
jgi:uncharacterized protein YlxW (UPF0749 family)